MSVQPPPTPSPNNPVYTPSVPDPQTTALVAAVIRHVLTLVAGLGFSVPIYSYSTILSVSAAIVGLISAIIALYLSIKDKYQAAKRDHEGSVASAESGIPKMVVH